MITYVFGKTGSGKSYKAVLLILEELKTRPVFSTIELTKYVAGYNFLDQKLMVDWMSFIEDLYNKSQNDLMPEEEIYSALRAKGIFNCSVFIDEAHIYGFNNSRRAGFLMFFLALQRHVNLNIFLITQTRKQLNSVFWDFGDVIITCVSPTERLSEKILEYRYFSHVDSIKKISDAFKNEKVIPKKDIFSLYTSGDSNFGDGGFRKKIKYLIFAFILIVIFTVSQFKSLFSNSHKVDDNTISSSNTSPSRSTTPTISKNLKYQRVVCISKNCNSSIIKDLQEDSLIALLTDTKSKILNKNQFTKFITIYNLSITSKFINLFENKEDKKEL